MNRPPRPSRSTFLMLTLVTCQLGCQALQDLSNPNKGQVVSILRILSSPVPGQAQSAADDGVYRATQVELLKSELVIAAALRDNKVRELPIVKAHADAVAWLKMELRVELIPNSELLRVALPVPSSAPKEVWAQSEQLLDTVIDAYLEEIVNKERREHVGMLHALRTRYQQATDDLKAKLDEVHQLKSKLGDASDLEQQLRLRQLDRLHSKRIDLELKGIQVRAMGTDLEREVAEAQLRLIQDAYEQATNRFKELSTSSGDVEAREEAIEMLQKDLQAIRATMQELEVGLEVPSRIHVIQAATRLE